MKKILMFTIVSCLSFTILSGNAQERCCKRNETPLCQGKKAECKSDVQKQWENFEKLSVEEQQKLIEIRKKEFKELHTKIAGDFKAKEEADALTEEMIQKKKELHKMFKAEWKRIDQLSLSEQKALLDKLHAALKQIKM